MANKQTKRTLWASALSLVLCVAMLVGSTFAWFTDSVTSGKNQIVAGNLDVEFEYTTDFNTWNSVQDATDLFDANAFWEPGYTQAVYLRARNVGTLALKYNFGMRINAETAGTNVNGDSFKLSEHLKYGIVENQTAVFADRSTAINAIKNPLPLKNYSANKSLAAGEETYFAIVVYMPTTVGNEANYRSDTVPTIDLGLKLTATQDTVETDGFGSSDYDADAWTSIEKQDRLDNLIAQGYAPVGFDNLTEATKKNDKIVVTEDLVVDQRTPSIQGTTTIDFNGGKIIRDTRNGNGLLVQNYDADITLENGEFVSSEGGNVVRVEAANSLTVKNSSFVCLAEGSTGNKIFHFTPSTPDKKMTVTFENCVFDTGYVEFAGYNAITEYDVRFVNCTFKWDDINGSSFVQADSYSKGTYSFDKCRFEYTQWWSGPLVEIDNYKEKSTANLNDITVVGTGDKKPYLISGFSYGGIKNLTVNVTGTNSYTYNGELQNWDSIAVQK